MLEAISILNQAATIAQFLHAPTWHVEAMNFPRYGYTVHLNPELQITHVATSVLEPSPQQQVSPNSVLYRAVPPCIVPVSNSSPPLTAVHGLDTYIDVNLLPFSSSDDIIMATAFIEHLIEIGRIDVYAIDKHGSRYHQHRFQFLIFAKSAAGLEKLMENAPSNEQKTICSLLETNLVTFCRGRYSCRVVQKAFECFDVANCLSLIDKLDGTEKDLSLHQHGNHVIQKIFLCVPFCGYNGIVNKYLASADILSEIVKDRYGCRVIQLSVQKLEEEVAKNSGPAASLLEQLVSMLLKNCWSYSTHQYANYVIQHIIASNTLEIHRNTIICELLNNLLSMSQEKYASHVVEKALKHAPPKLLHAMMNEIFDGYECDIKGHDALDVLLFDQFGNYVVQTMLEIAIETREKKCDDNSWFNRLADRIIRSQHKLMKYSSGKRILEKLSASRPRVFDCSEKIPLKEM
ncbi:unnamed protein product [Onchocerca ochengi]|uniref:PUM-HD domain-containing protein n=1 Tax=Onchocerca ochengi TaxID=42157 RepID=A0A182E292_ONCOC|nr:unnamed protein product [Onchocerca ochengi]